MSLRSTTLQRLTLAGVFSIAGTFTAFSQTIPGVCLNTDLVSSYKELYGRNITAPECMASHYNGGVWHSKDELKRYIQTYQTNLHAAPVAAAPAAILVPRGLAAGDLFVASDLSLRDSNLKVIAQPHSFLLSQDGGGLINPSAGIVASGGGNFSLQSVDGKKVYKIKK